MYSCMCNWVTMLYSRKLKEHSKPAIMGEKNDRNRKKKKESLMDQQFPRCPGLSVHPKKLHVISQWSS